MNALPGIVPARDSPPLIGTPPGPPAFERDDQDDDQERQHDEW